MMMKSPAPTTTATGVVLILLFAFIPTFSQSFSPCSRSSSLRTLQFQLHLQSHPTTAALDGTITPNNDDRITTTSTTTRRRDIIFHAAMMMAFQSPSTPAASAVSIDTTISISGARKFCGTYSDPINHPGGTRTISLIDHNGGGVDVVGDYRLAQVVGGGGIGEPKEYVLPAVVVGDRAIIIDFSPKGGPRDFMGVLEKDGAIKFVRDGNRWPRMK